MVLKKDEGLRIIACALSIGAASAWLLSGCSGGQDIDDEDVIVGRSDTACTPARGPIGLGTADSAFGCRGTLLETEGLVVGAARADKSAFYKLFVAFDGDDIKEQETEHSGSQTALVATKAGFVFVSISDTEVAFSGHDKSLAMAGKLGGYDAEEEILAFDAFSPTTRTATAPVKTLDTPAEGVEEAPKVKTLGESKEGDLKTIEESKVLAPAVIAIAQTATGPHVLYLDGLGKLIKATRPLKFGEMPYCNSARGAFDKASGGLVVSVDCQEVRPQAPTTAEGVATIPDFEYEGDIPPISRVTVVLDNKGAATSAEVTRAPDTAATPGNYELVRYVTEQVPRDGGHRVNVMDAITVGDKKVIAVSCVGPDGGAVELQTTLLECEGLPGAR